MKFYECSMEHTLSRYNEGMEEDDSQEHPSDDQQAEVRVCIYIYICSRLYCRCQLS